MTEATTDVVVRELPASVQDVVAAIAALLGDNRSSAIVLAGADQRHVHREASAVLKRAKTIRNQVGAVLPARRSGEVELDPDQKSAIRRSLRHSPAPDSKPPSFSTSAAARTATLMGRPFTLEYDQNLAESDARLMIDYFSGFEQFSGRDHDILELQDDTALEQAKELLGGATIKDTVNTALREFSDRDTRIRLFAHIQQLASEDLGDPDIMKNTRREQAPG